MRKIEYSEYLKITRLYYNEKFGNPDRLTLNVEEQDRWEVISSRLEKYLLNKQHEKIEILDFGCGDGRFSGLLTQYGCVTGVDLSEAAIEKAKEREPDCFFFVGDLSSEDIVESFEHRFDVVLSTEVLEHVYFQKTYLRNAFRLLKKGGFLILTTPNGLCYNHYFGRKTIKNRGQAFEWWVTLRGLISLLRHTGFNVLEKGYFSHHWIFRIQPKSWLKLIGNKYIGYLLATFRLKPVFELGMKLSRLGLYIVVVAECPENERKK